MNGLRASIGGDTSAVAASMAYSPASFLGSYGTNFLPRTKCMSGKIPSLVRLHPFYLAPIKIFKLQVRAARMESASSPALGSRAPDFELPEPLTEKVWKLDDFDSYPALLVMFICNHCPFVKHLKKDIARLTNFYLKKGLGVIAISSNSTFTHPQACGGKCTQNGNHSKPQGDLTGVKVLQLETTVGEAIRDGPKFMAEEAKLFGYPFPYVFDESQDVARAFGAVCTPEFFLYRKDGRRPFELFYHGQFDDSRPNNDIPVTGRDLSLAIDSALSAQQLRSVQKSSVGCSIKWHPEKSL